MNGVKISNLNLVESVAKTDFLPIVNDEETKKVSVEQLVDFIKTDVDQMIDDAIKEAVTGALEGSY